MYLIFSLPCKPPAEKLCTRNQETRLRSRIGRILLAAPTSTYDKRGCRARRRTQSHRHSESPDVRRGSRQRGATAASLRGSQPPRWLRPSPPSNSRFSAPRSFRKVPPPSSPTKPGQSRGHPLRAALHQRRPFPRSLPGATDEQRSAARAKPPPARYGTCGEKGDCVFSLAPSRGGREINRKRR